MITYGKTSFRKFRKFFVSYNSLVLDIDNAWKLINNLAVIEANQK